MVCGSSVSPDFQFRIVPHLFLFVSHDINCLEKFKPVVL